MKTQSSFSVEFNYTLSENVILRLTAHVQLHHSIPHYRISDFHFKSYPSGHPLLPDIDIVAIKKKDGISWVHSDSLKETLLSVAVGKAIEERNGIDIEYAKEGDE